MVLRPTKKSSPKRAHLRFQEGIASPRTPMSLPLSDPRVSGRRFLLKRRGPVPFPPLSHWTLSLPSKRFIVSLDPPSVFRP